MMTKGEAFSMQDRTRSIIHNTLPFKFFELVNFRVMW